MKKIRLLKVLAAIFFVIAALHFSNNPSVELKVDSGRPMHVNERYTLQRVVNYIVLHCTATPQNTSVESILKYWYEVRKWKVPGYHYLIDAAGVVHTLLPEHRVANGVQGYNSQCIHISYIGGVENGRAVDNRTPRQIESTINLLINLRSKYPRAIICGHHDFPNVPKACPSFKVKPWLSQIGLSNTLNAP